MKIRWLPRPCRALATEPAPSAVEGVGILTCSDEIQEFPPFVNIRRKSGGNLQLINITTKYSLNKWMAQQGWTG